MNARILAVAAAILSSLPLDGSSTANGDDRIKRPKLIADVRELGDLIEETHPDPYVKGGGKIAFHRRLQETIAQIPEPGMTQEEFYRHLRPFVAAVGDAHTWLRDPYQTDYRAPGGVPLYFRVIEEGVYVAAAPERYANLIGTRLVSVEGVALEHVVSRQSRLMGAENQYLILRNLAGTGVLWNRCFMEHLLPEWKDKSRVRLELRHDDGEIREHSLDVQKKMKYPLTSPSTKITLPPRDKCDFAYAFIDEGRRTALLVIDGMSSYREVFEYERAVGSSMDIDRAQEIYKRYHGTWFAPGDADQLIGGLPSATDTFRTLVGEMKAAGTERLLVDLRRNDGGASLMADFLVYLLYGREKLIGIKAGKREIRRLSPRYFAGNAQTTLEDINRERPVKLRENDYDLGPAFYARLGGARDHRELVRHEIESLYAKLPTFASLYQDDAYSGHYCPRHVVVLCSADTFSSGWTLMYYLKRAGALIVGTPSSQGPNCYGDVLSFTLEHSGVTGIVSQKRFEYFPDDPQASLLKPDHTLSYEKLAEHAFDPNTEILFALDVLDTLDK